MSDENEIPQPGDRLGRVALLVGVVAKDKTNEHDGYSYQSENAIKFAVHKACMEVGVVPSGVSFSVLSDEWVAARSGAKRNLVKVICSLQVDMGTYQGLGAGIDYGDKALMKAQTAALREAWKNALTIPSAEVNDPEADQSDVNDPAPPERSSGGTRQAPRAARRSPPRGRAPQENGEAKLPNMNWLGESAGAPLSEVPTSLLARYVEWRGEHPATGRWAQTEPALLDAIADELAGREENGDPGPPDPEGEE